MKTIENLKNELYQNKYWIQQNKKSIMVIEDIAIEQKRELSKKDLEDIKHYEKCIKLYHSINNDIKAEILLLKNKK